METGVRVWWIFLGSVAFINIVAWTWSSWTLWYRFKGTERFALRFPHVVLSGIFTLGCAYRSFFPKGDVQRMALIDSWLSSVFVGRSVATIAELCFVAQWALLLREIADRTHAPATHTSTRLIVPVIAVAECFSWYSVITTNYIGNVIEESLWMVTFGAISVGAVALWRFSSREFRPVLAAGAALGFFYTAFMFLVDVPLYATRYRADLAAGKIFLGLKEGLWDAATRWHVVQTTEAWAPEMAWMSLYFSVAVWMSIAVIHVRPMSQALRATARS